DDVLSTVHAHSSGVLQCRPQNTVRAGSDQTITLTWNDDPSCSAVDDVLIYELVVLIADKQVHYDQVVVRPDQIGSTHSWNWTSAWTSQCASVRLSSRYKFQTSPWKLDLTPPGVENLSSRGIYPKDKVYEVGSTVPFCCVLSEDQIFDKMYLSGNENSNSSMSTVEISNQTYVVNILLNQPSTTSCTDVKCKARGQNGDSESGACVYIGYPPGDKDLQCETRDLESVDCRWTVGRNSQLTKLITVYDLLGSRCAKGSQPRCSKKVKVDVGEKNWTLTARNELGTVELSDRADLTKRVHMFAPEGVTASSVNARTASLKWGWKLPQYNRLNITCQVNVSDGATNTMMLLANQSHGNITEYEVTTETDRITVPNTMHEYNISVNTTEEHLVTVTARNNNGSSPPSTITVPHYDPDTTRVNTSRISGSNGSVILSWSASPIANCGYTVDWCPSSGNGNVQWIKVPPHQTNATLSSELQDDLLQVKCIQQDSDLVVSWDPLTPSQLPAFIRGYILYRLDNNNKVIIVSTDNPEATSFTVRNLNIGSYDFSLKALTAVGESGTTNFSATVDTQTDKLITAVIISLLAGDPSCRPLYMDLCHYSEADKMDIPELQSKLGAPVKDYVSHEEAPFVFSPTPKGYYNQPLKNCTPPPLLLPTATDPSQSALPRSPLRSVFPNPSYSLIVQTGGQQSDPQPEQLEVPSGGYQPQNNTETFTLNWAEDVSLSPMVCVSTYLSLPQSNCQ
ncbi:hypothetical protein INR49_017446, partial [Caranx melampygus]